MKILNKHNGLLIALFVVVAMSCLSNLPKAHALVTLNNPDWRILLTDFGYSDLLFDNRPLFAGREYLSGEWGASVGYNRVDLSGAAVPVMPTWFEPNFIYPNWPTNSNFGVVSPMAPIAVNPDGFPVYRSVIQNPDLNVTITAQMRDANPGMEQGLVPASAPNIGNSITSTRYVLQQNYDIQVRRDNQELEGITDLNLFQFLHGLNSDTAVYDDRLYPAPGFFPGYQYDTNMWGRSGSVGYDPNNEPYNATHDDYVAFHSRVKPVAWEVGLYGIQGLHSHSVGKPPVGVHLSVENDALTGNDWITGTKWVSGAQKYDLTQGNFMQPGDTRSFELKLSVSTNTRLNPEPQDPVWNPGDPYKMHWPQPPDLKHGMNVLTGRSISTVEPYRIVLADDFKCTGTGPITDIHIWGSWLNDYLPIIPGGDTGQEGSPDNIRFRLSIHKDIPADPDDPGSYSMPGELVWEKFFEKGSFYVAEPHTADEPFYDPFANQFLGNDSRVYQYNFLINEDEAFRQEKCNIYWLDVEAFPMDDEALFGWKTTPVERNWNDDAVLKARFPGGETQWIEMHYPPDYPWDPYIEKSVNMSFVITGPLLGDFNENGDLDAGDIDMICAAIGSGDLTYDLNGDGVIDMADVAYWVRTIKCTEFGDADLDGKVYLSDLSILALNYGGPGGWAQGNFDCDGLVYLSDLSLLALNYGFVSPCDDCFGPTPGTGSESVPEPATLAMLGLGGLLLTRRRRA